MELSEIGDELRRLGFAERLEAERRSGFNIFEPWLRPLIGGRVPSSSLLDALHFGARSVAGTDDDHHVLISALADAHFLTVDTEGLMPGEWQLTSYNGLWAVRDAPVGEMEPAVYIGEDSLRFVNRLLELPPGQRCLDIGCGSGISTLAVGRRADFALGIDILPQSVEATRLTAELNHAGSTTEGRLADLCEFTSNEPFDRVSGNLPGVPVPPGLVYSAAGDGGPDGLDRIREFLSLCPRWCGPDSLIVMRFQSVGGPLEPILHAELRSTAADRGWDISVETDSRVPICLRSALSTHYAAPLNPSLRSEVLLETVDRHFDTLGVSEYYSSTMVARTRGAGRFVSNATYFWSLLDWNVEISVLTQVLKEREPEIVNRLLGFVGNLPDGFWELGRPHHVGAVLSNVRGLVEAMGDTRSLREAIESTFPELFDAGHFRERPLYVTASLVADAMISLGLASGRH